MKSLDLYHWIENIKSLMKDFAFSSFQHINRELNVEANTLSKLDLGTMNGRLQFNLFSFGTFALLEAWFCSARSSSFDDLVFVNFPFIFN